MNGNTIGSSLTDWVNWPQTGQFNYFANERFSYHIQVILSDIFMNDVIQPKSEKYQQLLDRITHVFCHKIPFHNLIGFRFEELTSESCRISFDMKPELVGNFIHGILHGGVTATALDMVGGATAAAAMLNKKSRCERR